ncbi:hypothetical protein FM076_33210 [Streptomyces albus subsp. chlorinus]|uniref:hypothetical protein n=1 Tax=Streptomyces albus TaxID=1888 RepID=UPI001570E7A5|nr:hypothetical protein [Streptomyces albus]NSC25744.1 hypothetical protein [Streptomyces albus subsp. chlorinus]
MHRDVLLDAGLSATARLLHVVLLAAADHGVPAEQVPALVGLPDEELRATGCRTRRCAICGPDPL